MNRFLKTALGASVAMGASVLLVGCGVGGGTSGTGTTSPVTTSTTSTNTDPTSTSTTSTTTSTTTTTSSSAPSDESQYVGDWEMSSVETGGQTYSGTTIDQVKSVVNVTMSLQADGTATLNILNQDMTGTWKLKDANTITITMEGSPQDFAIVDGNIVMDDGKGNVITLSKK